MEARSFRSGGRGSVRDTGRYEPDELSDLVLALVSCVAIRPSDSVSGSSAKCQMHIQN